MGCHTKDMMEKRDGAFIFKKKDLKIDLDDGTRYVVNPEKDICLYKKPYRPNGDGEEFYMHKTKNHGRQFITNRKGYPKRHGISINYFLEQIFAVL